MSWWHKFIMIFLVMLVVFATVIKADDDDNDNDDRSRRNSDNSDNSADSSDNARNTDDTRDNSVVNNANFNSDGSNRNQATGLNVNSRQDNRANGVRNNDNRRDDQQQSNINQTTRNSNQAPAQNRMIDDVDGMRDDRTGLSFRTLNLLANLPSCQQKTLLNYRKLLRSPSIRLQFFRDLYQLQQRDYVEGCAGDEGEMVRIGARERGILMGDKYFRRQVKFLMGKQAIGTAIRGPVTYPNDIGADPSASNTRILTITKQ